MAKSRSQSDHTCYIKEGDKKEGDEADASSDKEKLVKDGDDEETGSQKSEKKDAEKGEGEPVKAGPGPATSLYLSLRNVASQVPSMFKSKGPKAADKAADQDLEAGEKDDLLEKGETGDASNAEKKEGEGKHLQNAPPSGLPYFGPAMCH